MAALIFDGTFGHVLLDIAATVLDFLLVGAFLFEKPVESPLVHGLHFPLLMLQRLVDKLHVAPHLSAVAVDNSLADLKFLNFLVQFILVFNAEMLNLLHFDQVHDKYFLVEGEDVDEGADHFQLHYLPVGDLLYFEEVAEHVVYYYHASDCAEYYFVQLCPY